MSKKFDYSNLSNFQNCNLSDKSDFPEKPEKLADVHPTIRIFDLFGKWACSKRKYPIARKVDHSKFSIIRLVEIIGYLTNSCPMQSMWDSKWYHSPTTDHPRHPTYWKNLKNLESSRHIHDGQVLLPLPRHGIENRCWRSATGADPSVRRMFDVGRAASGRRASGRFARRNGSARSRMSSDSMDVD